MAAPCTYRQIWPSAKDCMLLHQKLQVTGVEASFLSVDARMSAHIKLRKTSWQLSRYLECFHSNTNKAVPANVFTAWCVLLP
jgi:hypothetical protein